ncbi:hypothetical protein QA601_10220 [Chitinispirillales bacterium ANBcel5]|uniref:hypothetical protein n=1 Tax=Cellulosispirillum alkaliphilum TaxID=3039283 RepID=UPI002A51C918|nr:hypothetical protein [Chitinispirillales bacterium ANBcel5]
MSSNESILLERGSIYFFYRPRVQRAQVKNESDIQRLHMILRPDHKGLYRMIAIGKKELPAVEHGAQERNWGFVELVTENAESLREVLSEERYSTKTRGERKLPAARAAGEGVYLLAVHHNHTHLAYSLELPRSPGDVQQELHIEEKASYIITVKNPQRPSPSGAGLPRRGKAQYPDYLMNKFEGKRFTDVEPPEFLNYEGCELVMVSASKEPQKELGVSPRGRKETSKTADLFKEFNIDPSSAIVKPLFKGEWQ